MNVMSDSSPQTTMRPGSSLGLAGGGYLTLRRRLDESPSLDVIREFERQSGFSDGTIYRVIQVGRGKLLRRRRMKLKPAESERLLRLALVFEKAVELFDGDRAAARRWLERPAKALGGVPPIEAVESESGARDVEALIGRIEHGVFT